MRTVKLALAAALLCLVTQAQTINGVPVIFGASLPQVANSNSLATKSSGSVSSLALAFTNPNTKGNSIIVVCAVGNSNQPSVTDSNSNSGGPGVTGYSFVAAGTNGSAFNVSIFIAANIVAGSNTVTCSNGGSAASIAMHIYEWSGILSTSKTAAVDVNSGGSATGTSLTSSSIVTSQASEIMIAGFAVGTAAQTITVGSPFSNDSGQQNPTTPAGLFSFAAGSYFSSIPETRAATATITSEPWAAVVASFRTVQIPVAGTVYANQGGTWIVQPGNTPNTAPWLVQSVPGTGSGLSWYNVEPAASDNHANIKNGAGVVYHIQATNNSGTVNYLRLYNAATGFNGCNSATNLIYSAVIPANTNGAGFVADIAMGITFSTGISICVSSAYGQTATTAATASAMEVNIGYK